MARETFPTYNEPEQIHTIVHPAMKFISMSVRPENEMDIPSNNPLMGELSGYHFNQINQEAEATDLEPSATDAQRFGVVIDGLLIDSIKRNPRTAIGARMSSMVLDILQNDTRSRVMRESDPVDSAEIIAEISDSLAGLEVAERLADLRKKIR